MNSFRRNEPFSAMGLAALLLALCLASWPAKAQIAQCPATPPTQTIKIFNDSDRYLFMELETGLGASDIWIQSICKIPNSQIPNFPYPRTLTNRIYINPDKGIAPGGSVVITIPLYTQLVANVNPTSNDQYAEWWQGENIQMFTSTTSSAPRTFVEAYKSISRPQQTPLTSSATDPTFPTCEPPCQLVFFKDTQGTLPKNAQSQLIEATLGARQQLQVVNDSPPNRLDVSNADFDVSYVNVAYAPAAMGPYMNDQVGYIGSPQQVADFRTGLKNFETDYAGWPRFVATYSDGTKERIIKFPSPLELFARLSPPGGLAPPDLDPPPHWPDTLWAPIENLRTQWKKYIKACHPSPAGTDFCDALLDARALLVANYNNYLNLFKTKVCTGTPVVATEDAILSHVYGWSPWVEAQEDKMGCTPNVNRLEITPTYNDNGYAKYLKVKLEFDKLNYGTLPNQYYVFNPWVQLIHGKYLNIEGAYAYSVDDAVGNIQAEAKGFIIDVGSLEHLENQQKAQPPINISLGYAPTAQVRFASYRVCKNDPAREKPVDPLNPTFIINAQDPSKCPVFLIDNKNQPQTYTFTVARPPPFTEFALSQVKNAKWIPAKQTPNTTSIIDCSGNTSTPPFQQSSKSWCCSLTNSSGVFAYSFPDPTSAHASLVNTVVTIPAQPVTSNMDVTCSMGK